MIGDFTASIALRATARRSSPVRGGGNGWLDLRIVDVEDVTRAKQDVAQHDAVAGASVAAHFDTL
jgi:hypothetical protein